MPVKPGDIERIKKVKIPPFAVDHMAEVLYNRAGITREQRLQALWEAIIRGDSSKASALDERMRVIEDVAI